MKPVEQGTRESLEALLHNARGRPRVDLLNRLASLISEKDPGGMTGAACDAVALARKIGYSDGEATGLFLLGEAHRIKEDLRHALENYTEAHRIFRALGNAIQQGRCLRRMGDIQFYVNNLNISMEHYLNALRIFEENDSSETRLQAGHLLATIGNVLRESGDLEDALEYYRRCTSVYEREGFSAGIPGILYNIGNVYQSMGSDEKALSAYREVLAEAEGAGDDYLGSLALNSLGSLYMTQNRLDMAEDYFNRSRAMSKSRQRGILSASVKLVELKRLQGKLEDAMELSRSAEKLAEQLGDRRNQADLLKERALVYRESGQYENALSTFLGFQELQEELLSEKRVHQLDILRLRYETEARERELQRLRRERTVQRRMIAGAVVSLAFAGVSLVSVYRNMRFRTRINHELECKNDQLAGAYSRVEKLSRTDALTELANRRAMMERLESEHSRSNRTGRTFGVIIADIDNFKEVNDTHGHACGDEVLVQISRRFEHAIRKQDIASRWGGEEFLFLLPETNLRFATRVAEKIRTAVEDSPFIWKNVSVRLTMTFGVSEGGRIPLEESIQKADSALYKGKEMGKNRVSTCEAEPRA